MKEIAGMNCTSQDNTTSFCFSLTKTCDEIVPQMNKLQLVLFNTTFSIPAETLCVSDYISPITNKVYSVYIPVITVHL